MGRKAKRARVYARRARLLGEQNVVSEPSLVVDNSQKIEELKTNIPEPVIEEPITLEEPKFMTEAEPVEVKKEAPKAQVKKKTTRARKATPRKRTTKKANTKS